jgi:hypothetical protein
MHRFALSGYAQPEHLEPAKQEGSHQHIAKPPDLAHLERLRRPWASFKQKSIRGAGA